MTQVVIPAELALPVIETAFTRRLHPYWPQLRERTKDWLSAMRLMPADRVERYADGLRYTDLMASYYLDAPAEILQAIADFASWFFIWDDRHDRDTVYARTEAWDRLRFRLHAAVDSPKDHLRHADPVLAGFADSVARLYSHLPGAWNARFARHFHPVIEAYHREFLIRISGDVLAVDDFIEHRRLTFAHEIWIDLLELSAGRELPARVRRHPPYRRAAVLSQDFAAWYNDLCSFPKEAAVGDPNSLGNCLIRHADLTRQQACAEVRRRVTGSITEFLALEPAVSRFADRLADGTVPGQELRTAVRAGLANSRNWFSAVYWFHHESDRYAAASWRGRAAPVYVEDGGNDGYLVHPPSTD